MSSGSDSAEGRRTFGAAVRFAAVVIVVALAVLGLAMWWVSDCKSGTGSDQLANCGALQRDTLAGGAPLILFLGGLGAFIRTYQVWRASGRWWIWQGAGWFLLALMLLVLTITGSAALR